ncbi:hypothetical protein LCGC14_1335330 [marine sediment metagenome]|uniref:Nucleoside 2-deoxyribosyltransferase n=1 Tax=marine sediment metagenome TaxID=412755 RepID=A0A0F9KG37_9ZZZZ
MKIYVASSWRNQDQPGVIGFLKEHGHEVYDFRNPSKGDKGFHWSEIDENWKKWSQDKYRTSLSHTIAEQGFKKDFDAMVWANVFVLVMPCGRSAHLEAGWAIGQGKPTAILLSDKSRAEPELMYKMADTLCLSLSELIVWLKNL